MKAKTADTSLNSYFTSLAHSKPLGRDREVELAVRVRQGDMAARDDLVQANLRFVVDIAKQYQNRGIELADLIGAGNLGLLTAAERFDGGKGVKFISYAVWWIRQAVLQLIAEQGRMVRLPYNKQGLLRRIKRLKRAVEDPGSLEEDDIAGLLGVAVHDISDTLKTDKDAVSLDVGDDDGRPLLDGLSDPEQKDPDAGFWQRWARSEVLLTLDGLERRERFIVWHYYGLDGETRLSLEEIGVELGITRERVRQIKRQALEKLNTPRRANRLRATAAYL
jgi:RNA polymerase primary sigma factor